MTVTIEARQVWGAAPPSGSLPALTTPVTDVFLHHEGGGIRPASMTVDEERAAMREIQSNTMARGYSDFPYGAAVFGSGRAYEGRDLGFVCGGITVEEAATYNNNATSVAIVWPGDYNQQNPTDIQIVNTAGVIQIAQLAGVVTLNPDLRGHRDVYPTACPGNSAYFALTAIRSWLAAPVPIPDPVPNYTAWVQAVNAHNLHYGDRGPNVDILNALLFKHHFIPNGGDVYSDVTAHGMGSAIATWLMPNKDTHTCDGHDAWALANR